MIFEVERREDYRWCFHWVEGITFNCRGWEGGRLFF